MARVAISKRVRFEIFKRDKFACQYCGRTPPHVTLQIDHILAVSNGGTNEKINLVTSCFDCNAGKSNVLLSDLPEPLANQIEEQRERLEQVKAFNRFTIKARKQTKVATQLVKDTWYEACKGYKSLQWPMDRDRSISLFLQRLSLDEVLHAVDVALAKKPPQWWEGNEGESWKYFCGVCWKIIKGGTK